MLDDKTKNDIHMAILKKIMSDMGDEGMKRFDGGPMEDDGKGVTITKSTIGMTPIDPHSISGVSDDIGASGPTDIPMKSGEFDKPDAILIAGDETPTDEEDHEDWGSPRINKKMMKRK
jgi:hypothetical protein